MRPQVTDLVFRLQVRLTNEGDPFFLFHLQLTRQVKPLYYFTLLFHGMILVLLGLPVPAYAVHGLIY